MTIVIPARNEAKALPLLLGDLERQVKEGMRVVVVDDHSDDGTTKVAASFPFVEVVEAPPLEAGWLGKAWACHAGARDVREGVLVFLDADVRFHEDALDRVLETQEERRGLLSVWPYHVVEKAYEHLSAIFNVVAFMASGAGSVGSCSRSRVAFGPVLVTDVESYRRAGGHAAARSDVIDDFALARAYVDAGLPVSIYGGGKDVSFRMYPEGMASLIEGWTKNFASGALAIARLRLILIPFWLICSLGALTWAGGIPAPLSNVLAAAFVFQMIVFFKQVGRFSVLDGLLYPVHVVFFFGVFLRSFVRTFFLRRVSWRGRMIDLAEDPLPPESP